MSLQYDPALSPCPICGKKAYVAHDYDSYDRVDWGWDAGCPTFKIGDGKHGIDDYPCPANERPRVAFLASKQEAIDAWNLWVERWKERHNAT